MKRFTKFSLSGVGLALLLMACTPGNTPTVSLEGLKFAELSPLAQSAVNAAQAQGQKDITVLDVGHGQKTGAAFSVSLHFQEGKGSFSTQASSSGIPASTSANKVEVYLMEFDGAPPSSGALPTTAPALKHSQVFAKNLVGGAQTFVFSNVPASGNATSKFYVAARLIYDNPTPAYLLNLVKPASTPITLALGANGPIVLSNGGGSGNSGGVFVDPRYQIAAADNAQLTMTMQLDDEKGASIDSKVTVTDGTTGIGAIGVTSP
ncbi:hypothetical protein COW36_07275 [bacterium (Candidatus Blackallbacteria) CG17_big_fil_post_rev_8_21_14_2_50_48_46]|uniref:Lipoprotein n=1 Tax=bacterium (Candidatus Blackallbacteria) CG17_big_fil_post_rev_8_21_14_2_50_48_46 TaxID=2014261 RepID=A0A2M7G744_9BACT|nr:MAG: hypothetical protein COW64_06785 [bacterium (Candidatus Blackallbacteria) CG18_big_fil_WC_8_21_14_2_50_49_26]PIW17863.1 MAG: hypothetical protein COW36_07275 [bacterium (Candidatus Blackallbacteria) CG17_big_fil_post_rev_8_21_14_2_50_48_46]PIW48539.1 MAG: hypothetical protein COW20_09230 [bacterium (Candidatus Blackallbacteria) CG13_big_fil_rev_8_21_14_2_50_49_14]